LAPIASMVNVTI